MVRSSTICSPRPRGIPPTLVLLAVLGCGTAVGCAGSSPRATALVDGEAVYERYCAVCHGPEGNGQGPASYLLFPKPRNFAAGRFKLRSTPMGKMPTDEDLIRTVSNGIPGTAMFAFGELLTEDQVGAAVQHVKSLAPRFATATPVADDELLRLPPAPPSSPELVAAGREVYATFRCAQCHGPEGKGDGPSAPGLVDSEGTPFPAVDFTHGIYKSGGRPEDLYRTFLTGMEGTPMPSYASAIESDEQAWALVYYVLSLTPGGEAQPTAGDPGPLVVTSVDDAGILDDPAASGWDAVPEHRVYVRPLWFRSGYSPIATVRAARVGEQIALLLEWRDATHNAEALRTQDFSDAAAMQFALTDIPPFLMGQPGPGNEVEIWYWRAARQAARERGEMLGLESVYPDVVADRYPFAEGSASEPGFQGNGAAVEQAAPYVTGRDAGNPVSNPALATRPVHSLAAAGYGSLTTRPADQMRAEGNGVWNDGIYRVVFSAPIQSRNPQLEADFSIARVPFAVAIWDGGAGDRNGTKLVSQWITLELESPDR
ncbi:MAG: c-type cytochrome [Acidobacteria bacterium]|nr:c-type cytochrome [Acidobacteriota bacterium]